MAARGNEGSPTFDVDVVSCEEAVIKDKTGRGCGVKKADILKSLGSCVKTTGRFGLYDMVGNAEEWVEDWLLPAFLSVV